MNIIRLLHRLTGVAGSPGTVQPSGVAAINFAAAKPELWASDGTTWHQLNTSSAAASSAQIITGTATGVFADPASLAGASVTVSTGAGDAGKYVRADTSGLVDDTLVPKASGAQTAAGTLNDVFLTPLALAGGSTILSAGAGDAGKLVKLDGAGLVDDTVLPKATAAQTAAGTSNDVVLTPLALAGGSVVVSAGAGDAGKLTKLDAAGLLDDTVIPKATSAQVAAGVLNDVFITPLSLAASMTSNSVVVSAGAPDAGKLVKLDGSGLFDDTVIPKAVGTDVTALAPVNDLFLTPANLRAGSTVTSAGVTDQGKYIRLDSNGKIDTSLLNVDAMELKAVVPPAAAAPAAPNKGDVYVISADGPMAAGWSGITPGTAMNAGDQLIYDGAVFQVVNGANINPDLYVPIAGTAGIAGASMNSGALITFNPTATGNVILYGSTAVGTYGAVDRIICDCGTF